MAITRYPELPSYEDVVRRFALFDTGRMRCDTQIGAGGSLRCGCRGCSDWYAFLGGRTPYSNGSQYEVFTREHLEGLATYIRDRAQFYNLPSIDILEVGAGNGRLAYHLGLLLSKSEVAKADTTSIHLTATDKCLAGVDTVGVVTQEDALEALSRVQPQVVIASWMPMGVDWTAHMRATNSVLEYILIGETDDGICGDPLLTWGFDPFGDSLEASTETDDQNGAGPSSVLECGDSPSKWKVQGWNGVELSELSRYQICRTDERWSVTRHSHTVSFRRNSE